MTSPKSSYDDDKRLPPDYCHCSLKKKTKTVTFSSAPDWEFSPSFLVNFDDGALPRVYTVEEEKKSRVFTLKSMWQNVMRCDARAPSRVASNLKFKFPNCLFKVKIIIIMARALFWIVIQQVFVAVWTKSINNQQLRNYRFLSDRTTTPSLCVFITIIK